MKDDQNKKLMRLFGVTWFLLLIVFIALLFTLLREPDKQINNYTAERGQRGESAYEIAVKYGFNGTEIAWLESLKGADGITPTVNDNRDTMNAKEPLPQVATVEKQTIIERVPEKGDKGNDGRTPELEYNVETGDLMVRYDANEFWQVLMPACAFKEKGCKGE